MYALGGMMQTFWIFDMFLALLRLGAYTISNLDQFIRMFGFLFYFLVA